ncbi:MAG: hypothetical protein QOF84_2214 [Streptomyces sp.]|nr:hypothetical protein [Streptomyces sp.]
MNETAEAAPPQTLAPTAAAPPPAASAGAPPQWHRGLTVLAVISLFIGTRALWIHAMATHPVVGGVVSLCYAAILVTGILALSVRGRAALARVDLAVLLTAIALTLCGFAVSHGGSDEGVLTAQAAHEILHGNLVYGQPWPFLFQDPHIAVTPTMSGGIDYTYGYPPLTALLSVPVYAVIHSAVAVTMVSTGALIAGTVALWVMVPAPWRSAATMACLGFGMLPGYARMGYPAIVALALLIPVAVRWPGIGAGGRLGRPGVLRAVCLGAACAAQQLPWFVTPFLLAGVYVVRRGELGPRAALVVVARFTGVVAATWLAVNAYFIAQDPSGWLSGITLPITQGAIIHGQGAVDLSLYFTDGSSRLSFYSYASVLLLLGLLGLFVLFIGRLGPAATILPWCAFYVATRSQDGYYLMMTPLWLAAAATVPSSAFAKAWRPRLPVLPRFGRTAKGVLAVALVAPSLACVAVAAGSSPPLRLRITAEHTTDHAHRNLAALTVYATNPTGSALTPHFVVSTGQGTSLFWRVRTGPRSLAPHHTARYVLLPPKDPYFRLPASPTKRVRLRAFTPSPATLTSVDIPRPVGATAGPKS